MKNIALALSVLSSPFCFSAIAQEEETQRNAGRQYKLPALIMVLVQSHYFGEFGAFEEKAIELELCSEPKLAQLLQEKYPTISAIFENPSVSGHYADILREKYGHANGEQMLRAKEMSLAAWNGFTFGYRVAMTKIKAQDDKAFCDAVRSSFADFMKAASSWADKPPK